MVIKANPVKEIVLIVLAVLAAVAICIAIFAARVSAAEPVEAEVDVNPLNIEEMTAPTESEEKEIVEEKTETTEPVESETTPQNATEENHTHDNKTNEKTETGCSHVWKDEYIPETETTEGSITRECLKCGEFKVLQTIPALSKD